MSRIAYLGPQGTYSETCANTYAKLAELGRVELVPYNTIWQVIQAVAEGQTDWAIAPVENSIQGSVAITLDGLWQWDRLQIQQAIVLPIDHSLITRAQSLGAIQVVYSHAQGLGQCQQWLERHLPHAQQVPVASTAQGLQLVKEQEHTAAIASHHAAEIYHLPVLVRHISDYPANYTRFWVLGATPPRHDGTTTSWGFSFAQNRPGTLASALHTLAQRQINLSRIESRPSKRSLGEYIFFVDIAGAMSDPAVQAAWHDLLQITESLKHFGSYDIVQLPS